MEHTRSRPAAEQAPGLSTAPACSACGQALDGVRCLDCGATAAAGGFRVLRLLHEGPHSRVYQAVGRDGQRVALKELLFAKAPDAKVLDDFEREAALLRQLEHAAIPRFVASFSEGSGAATRLYLAQELIEGTTLLERLGEHRFDEAEARGLAAQILDVLGYLHGLSPPVLHRDLKPANLVLGPGGQVTLVDFGSAREVRPGGTHRATLSGTFGYLPPEALGGSVDQTTDLYGLGATLVHLLSRRPPEEVLWDAVRPALGEHVQASAGFVAWLSRLTAPRRADRFQSVEEARRALEAPEPEHRVARSGPRPALLPEGEAEELGLQPARSGLGFRRRQGPGPARRRRLLRWFVAAAALFSLLPLLERLLGH